MMETDTFLGSVCCPKCELGMVTCNSHGKLQMNKAVYLRCINQECDWRGKVWKRPSIRIREV